MKSRVPTHCNDSRKLSTGVDARNVRFIVLMRTVISMVEFKQIVGRGTRLYDDKDYFTIVDFWQRLEVRRPGIGMASRKEVERKKKLKWMLMSVSTIEVIIEPGIWLTNRNQHTDGSPIDIEKNPKNCCALSWWQREIKYTVDTKFT